MNENNFDWQLFFKIANEVLDEGSRNLEESKSYCAWTTFSALESTCNYWYAGIPALKDLDEKGHKDGGVWRQPFDFSDLAH
ncbi:MAG: hypothetical protein OQJ89_16575, partial [Kangiellaceae bacterium]|nr:hypothetical protein [Kangiellaceae bacterium]